MRSKTTTSTSGLWIRLADEGKTRNGKLQRNKFLTEQTQECWHVVSRPFDVRHAYCEKCDTRLYLDNQDNNNFSTAEGFFKLLNWAKTKEWWSDFIICKESDIVEGQHQDYLGVGLIDPDRLANRLYELLKGIPNYG